MKFQKGMPRPANAGRKKGSLNKKKIPKVSDFLANKDLNPAEEILKILEEDKELPEKKQKISKLGQIDIWLDLLSYCQGKPKDEAEPSGDDDEPDALDELSDEQLLRLVKPNEAM